jgi:hypothetical protein
MTDRADLLMRSGIVHLCPDCRDERIFVSTDDCDADGCDFCCTTCGAAVLIDPVCDYDVLATRVA